MKTITQLRSYLLQPHLRIYFRLLLVCCIIAIAILAFTTIDQNIGELNHDKANHVAAFFVLALLLDYAYPQLPEFKGKLFALMIYASFIEVVQYFLPYRTFSIVDIAADFVGAICYIIIKHRLMAISHAY